MKVLDIADGQIVGSMDVTAVTVDFSSDNGVMMTNAAAGDIILTFHSSNVAGVADSTLPRVITIADFLKEKNTCGFIRLVFNRDFNDTRTFVNVMHYDSELQTELNSLGLKLEQVEKENKRHQKDCKQRLKETKQFEKEIKQLKEDTNTTLKQEGIKINQERKAWAKERHDLKKAVESLRKQVGKNNVANIVKQRDELLDKCTYQDETMKRLREQLEEQKRKYSELKRSSTASEGGSSKKRRLD